MFAGVGLAAYSAGIFHVFTHAFFKALLFLGAGSVIYALHHEQDVWKMGGLKKKMPLTYLLMVVGSLALAGFPPFAGFFSKDEILFLALAKGHFMIWLIGVSVAGMTAYYTFRMVFLVFWGEPRDKEAYDHAHEPPMVMTAPLVVLAIGAAFAGFLNLPALFGGSAVVSHWLEPSVMEVHPHASLFLEFFATVASIAVVICGIYIAYKKFSGNAEEVEYSGFCKWGYNKFYVDELYNAVFVQPYIACGRAISRFFEPKVTDSPTRAAAWLYQFGGRVFKAVQAGYVRVYAIYMVVGLSIMSIFLSLSF